MFWPFEPFSALNQHDKINIVVHAIIHKLNLRSIPLSSSMPIINYDCTETYVSDTFSINLYWYIHKN